MKKLITVLAFAMVWTNFVFAQSPSGVVPTAPAPKPAPVASAPVAPPAPAPTASKAVAKASSVGVFESMAACLAAAKSDKVSGYEPTMLAKGHGPERVKGLTLRKLESDACADMDVAVGRKWVLLRGHPEVYTNGANVVYLAECQNTIYKVVPIKDGPTPPVTMVPTTVTATSTVVTVQETIQKDIILKEAVFCDVNGTTVPATMQGGKAVCPTLTIVAPVTIEEPVRVRPSVVDASQGKSVTTETCTKDCTPHEEVRVVREEKRADGRCFVQTNMGYKFELRAQAKSGNTVVGLVDPSTNKLIADTKARHIAADLKAPRLADGKPDCDGMQSQLYKSWEDVRKSYELPSSCRLSNRPQQGDRRQQV